MNAANFSRTPLGRALLHAACLCRHPAAACFFLTGFARNLRQCFQHRARRPWSSWKDSGERSPGWQASENATTPTIQRGKSRLLQAVECECLTWATWNNCKP